MSTTPPARLPIPPLWRNHRGELDGALMGRTGAHGLALYLVWSGYAKSELPVLQAVLLCLLIAVIEAAVYHMRRGQDVGAETERVRARLHEGAEFARNRAAPTWPFDGDQARAEVPRHDLEATRRA